MCYWLCHMELYLALESTICSSCCLISLWCMSTFLINMSYKFVSKINNIFYGYVLFDMVGHFHLWNFVLNLLLFELKLAIVLLRDHLTICWLQVHLHSKFNSRLICLYFLLWLFGQFHLLVTICNFGLSWEYRY
jgi:hypothetical protein